MAILDIARMGTEVLKDRAQEVTNFDIDELTIIFNDMIETMIEANGIGLAAPQVFLPLRIVIFSVPESRNNGNEIPLTKMINPIIKPKSENMDEDWESCLSVPGLAGIVPRWTNITYSYQDSDGTLRERDASGYHARVVQHECDHLDGILYPMRMIDLSTLSFVDTSSKKEVKEEDL